MTDKQNNSQEQLLANALSPIIRELLYIDIVDFIAFLRFGKHNQIGDLVDSATEQFFAPGFVGYRESGEAIVEWNQTPTIVLHMVLNTPNLTFDFSIILDSVAARFKITDVHDPSEYNDTSKTYSFLQRAIEMNKIVGH